MHEVIQHLFPLLANAVNCDTKITAKSGILKMWLTNSSTSFHFMPFCTTTIFHDWLVHVIKSCESLYSVHFMLIVISVAKVCEWHHFCLRQKVAMIVKWSITPTSQGATISNEVVDTEIFVPPPISHFYSFWPCDHIPFNPPLPALFAVTFCHKKQHWIGGDYLNNNLVQMTRLCDILMYYLGTRCALILLWIIASNIIHMVLEERKFWGTVCGPVVIMNCTLCFISWAPVNFKFDSTFHLFWIARAYT